MLIWKNRNWQNLNWQLAQLISFQIFWLVSVIGQNKWIWIAALLLIAHFVFSPTRKTDLLVLPLALIGMTVDGLLILSGIFQFDTLPLWLGIIWLGFILTLGHSLKWLRKLPLVALIPIGALAGTSSYLAGWKLGAVSLPEGLLASSLTLIIIWSGLLPLFVKLDNSIRTYS